MGLKKRAVSFEKVRVPSLKNCSKKAREQGLTCMVVFKDALRTSKFVKSKKGKIHPQCDRRLNKGGRSPGLIRKGVCKR